MCILLVSFKVRKDLPVIVAANRDEYYDRSSDGPQLLNVEPRVFGGLDRRAGGTWLGVNEYGLCVAITNKHTASPPSATAPSRGLLCTDALRRRDAADAVRFVAAQAASACYNPFSLVLVDPEHAWAVTNWPDWEVAALTPGWHALGNTTIDAADDPRVRRALRLVGNMNINMQPSLLIATLQDICGDHGRNGIPGTAEDTLCMHGEQAGTRSASILTIDQAGVVQDYRHADGPPCSARFQSMQVPWQPLGEG